jgi:ankyrin repeat protein
MLRFLLDLGADPTWVGKHGKSPLMSAIESGKTSVLELLLLPQYGLRLRGRHL